MTENALVKTENLKLAKVENDRTLPIDVATKMSETYDLVEGVVKKLCRDTRVDAVLDDDGKVIGQKTHVHPQLLSWIKEWHALEMDIWKTGGGDIEHEAEKVKIETQAKIVLAGVANNPDLLQEKMEEWKKNRSFKK